MFLINTGAVKETIRVYESLAECCLKAGLEYPDRISATTLRKYMATITQVGYISVFSAHLSANVSKVICDATLFVVHHATSFMCQQLSYVTSEGHNFDPILLKHGHNDCL